MSDEEGKKLIEDFERMLLMAEARAYSKLSLERPLTDSEFEKYKAVAAKLGIEV